MLIELSFVGGIGLITTGWIIGVRNTLVMAENDIEGMFADIKIEYQRRADILYNLVESVKSHKDFEKSTMIELAKARSGINQWNTKTKMSDVKKIDGIFSGLKVQLENYPELKSMPLYQDLQNQVKISEDRINEGRAEYNNMIEDYNTYINIFPRNILCINLFDKKNKNYWEVDKNLDHSYKIKM